MSISPYTEREAERLINSVLSMLNAPFIRIAAACGPSRRRRLCSVAGQRNRINMSVVANRGLAFSGPEHVRISPVLLPAHHLAYVRHIAIVHLRSYKSNQVTARVVFAGEWAKRVDRT